MKRPQWLDDTFRLSVTLKGIDGVLEVIGGLLLAVTSPATLDRIVVALTQHELSQDPHDFLANHLLRSAQNIGPCGNLFAAAYLLSHGVIKIVLVVNLLKRKLWAYPAMIAVLIVFILYQLYRIGLDHSLSLTLLTIFDAFVVWLTYREYRRLLRSN